MATNPCKFAVQFFCSSLVGRLGGLWGLKITKVVRNTVKFYCGLIINPAAFSYLVRNSLGDFFAPRPKPVTAILLMSGGTQIRKSIVRWIAINVIHGWGTLPSHHLPDDARGKKIITPNANLASSVWRYVADRLPKASGFKPLAVAVVGEVMKRSPLPLQFARSWVIIKALAQIIRRWQSSFNHLVLSIRAVGQGLVARDNEPSSPLYTAYFGVAQR